MKSLTRPELEALLSVAKNESFDDYLMFKVTFNHGLRVSEACGPTGITREHITSDGWVTIDRLKGSNVCRHPLNREERDFLMQRIGTLFPICRMTFWRRMQYYGEKAGIPEHLRHPHALRHTTGRLGHKEGGMGPAEVAMYLGHKNKGNALIYMEPDERETAMAFAAVVGV